MALLLGLSSAGHAAKSKLPSWAKDLDRELASPRTSRGEHVHEDDPWLILYSEVVLELAEDGKFVRRYRKAWQNIGEEKRPLSMAFPFDSATEELTGLTAARERGRLWTIITGRNAGIEIPELSSDFVTADRIKVLKTSDVRPGDRVFATWTVTSSETYPGEWILMPMENLPIDRFVVRAGSGLLVRAVATDGTTVAVGAEGHELAAMPATHRVHDPHDEWRASPLMSRPFLLVALHPADESGWRSAAVRTRRLFEEPLAADRAAAGTPEFVRKARELTAGLETTQEKIAALASFAQSLVYRNVEWGEGAFRPEPPSEALRTMSGDCKAKSLLLKAMLAEVGVESVPVLARMGEPYLDYRGPATTNIFNHMLLAVRSPGGFGDRARLDTGVGKGWVLFDPTDPLATFGLPPNRLQGTPALWLDEGGDLFTVEYAHAADRYGVHLEFDAREPDIARFRMTIDGASAYAAAAKWNSDAGGLLPRLRRYAQQSLRLALPGLELHDVLYEPPDHLAAQAAKVTLLGSVSHPAKPLNAQLMAMDAPTALIAHALGLPRRGFTRPAAKELTPVQARWQTPVCCSARENWWIARIEIALPQGWVMEYEPELAALDNPWILAEVDNDGGSWRASVRTLRGRFPTATPARRIADLNRVANTMRRAFVVRAAEG